MNRTDLPSTSRAVGFIPFLIRRGNVGRGHCSWTLFVLLDKGNASRCVGRRGVVKSIAIPKTQYYFLEVVLVSSP